MQRLMASSSSPYAVFKADDWMIPGATIGLAQCKRVKARKRYQSSASKNEPNGSTAKMVYSKKIVQLAFA